MDTKEVLQKLKTFLKIDIAEAYPNRASSLDAFTLLRVIEFLERADDFNVEDIEDVYCDIQESEATTEMPKSELYLDILVPEILEYVNDRLDALDELDNLLGNSFNGQ